MDRFPEIPRLDHELTAMYAYPRLFAGWTAVRLAKTPTLFVRVSDLMPEAEGDDDALRASWALPHTEVMVPGDHFTMLSDHASATARAIDDWLARA